MNTTFTEAELDLLTRLVDREALDQSWIVKDPAAQQVAKDLQAKLKEMREEVKDD